MGDANFSFLKWQDELRLAQGAERAFAHGPSTTMIKMRQLGEAIAQHATAACGAYVGPEVRQVELLRVLETKGMHGRESAQVFHAGRRSGNRAALDSVADHKTALYALNVSRRLAVWFFQTFGEPNFTTGAFKKPRDPSEKQRKLEDEVARLHAKLAESSEGASVHDEVLEAGRVGGGQPTTCIHQSLVFRARSLSVELEPRLLSHYANSLGHRLFIYQGRQTTNLASLSNGKVIALPVPLIIYGEQQALLELVLAALVQARTVPGAQGAAVSRRELLDQAILVKPFRGEFCQQAPNNEPASVLLEKIRTELEAAEANMPTRGRSKLSSNTSAQRRSAKAYDGAPLELLRSALTRERALSCADAQPVTGRPSRDVRRPLMKLVAQRLAHKRGARRGTRFKVTGT